MKRACFGGILVLSIILAVGRGGQVLAVEDGVTTETDRLIVKWKTWVPEFVKEQVLKQQEILSEQKLKLEGTLALHVDARRAEETVGQLNKSLWVEYAEPDYLATAVMIPNDQLIEDQWGLNIVNAIGAWDVTHGSNEVDIAILDTGIDKDHLDLSGKVVKRVNFTSQVDDDGNGHGTHVAGIAGAVVNNGLGIAGLGYDVRLMSVKVLDNDGNGYYSWLADGITWATDNGAEVINLSLAGSASSRTLQRAVEYAWNHGVVIVAAAGNNGNNIRMYPAYYSQVIAVAATSVNDTKTNWSTYGSWVDISAPGDNILSTYNSGGYMYLSGTSMAAPMVSGLVGLVKGQHLGWSNAQVRNQIESTAQAIAGTGDYWIYGRIDACAAVGCGNEIDVVDPTITPSPTFVVLTVTPTPVSSNTPTPTAVPTSIPTQILPSYTPTPVLMIPTNTPTPTVIPTPTFGNLPWWCKYLSSHKLCK